MVIKPLVGTLYVIIQYCVLTREYKRPSVYVIVCHVIEIFILLNYIIPSTVCVCFIPRVALIVTPPPPLRFVTHAMTNVCIKHIYKVIYDLSVDLVTLDLGLTLKVKSRAQTFQGVCLINGASYEQSLCEIHITRQSEMADLARRATRDLSQFHMGGPNFDTVRSWKL